jgi:hypothetical protein
MRLAATAGLFAESLELNPHAAGFQVPQALGWLDGVPEAYGAGSRPVTLRTMLQQAQSLGR